MNLKVSDTGDIMRLPDALKHFGDLYGDGNPDTNPTLDDLKNAKSKADKQKYNKNTKEGKYLLQLTNDIEKMIDTKIRSLSKSATAESQQRQLGADSNLIRLSPSEVVKAYWTDLDKGKYSEVAKYVSSESLKTLKEQGYTWEEAVKGVWAPGRIQRIEILKEEEIQGEKASVNYKIYLKTGQSESANAILIKENGEWKLKPW